MNTTTRILFVCHGNICRSPMAEFVMKKLVADAGRTDEFEIASAATSTEELGNRVHRGTARVLDRLSIDYSGKRARQISRSEYEKWDLIVVMDEANVRNARRIFGGDPERKIRKLMAYAGESRDVADPWYTGDFEQTYRDVDKGCRALLKTL